MIQGQPRQKVHETPSQPIFKKLGMVAHACHSSYVGSMNRRISIQAGPGKKHEILSEK
jgi:hypothetical protein